MDEQRKQVINDRMTVLIDALADPTEGTDVQAVRNELTALWAELASINSKQMRELQEVQREQFQIFACGEDPRTKVFSELGSNRTPPFHGNLNPRYWSVCLNCGTNKNISRAHIVANSTKLQNFLQEKFGENAGNGTVFDGESQRNHVPLCGTLG